MFYVYVLRSVNTGRLYKGQTMNLSDRLYRHFAGQSISTKSLLPLELVYVQICDSRSEAISIERYLKSGVGRGFLKQILA